MANGTWQVAVGTIETEIRSRRRLRIGTVLGGARIAFAWIEGTQVGRMCGARFELAMVWFGLVPDMRQTS